MQVSSVTPVGGPGHVSDSAETPTIQDKQRSIEAGRVKQEQLRKLRQRDSEVRTHEAAHLAAAGALALGGPSFSLQTGPDGTQFAVGGSVRVDTTPGATPEETIQKARQLRAAALAPADPSPQDLAIAAAAAAMELQARRELQQAESEEKNQTNESENGETKPAKLGQIETPDAKADEVSKERTSNIFSGEFLKAFMKGETEFDGGITGSNDEDDEENKSAPGRIGDTANDFGFQSVPEDRVIEEFLNAFVSGTLFPQKGLNMSLVA